MTNALTSRVVRREEEDREGNGEHDEYACNEALDDVRRPELADLDKVAAYPAVLCAISEDRQPSRTRISPVITDCGACVPR